MLYHFYLAGGRENGFMVNYSLNPHFDKQILYQSGYRECSFLQRAVPVWFAAFLKKMLDRQLKADENLFQQKPLKKVVDRLEIHAYFEQFAVDYPKCLWKHEILAEKEAVKFEPEGIADR